MYTFALTLIINRSLENSFASWLSLEGVPLLNIPSDASLRITKVVAVPGDPGFAAHELSVSLHINFDSPSALKSWMDANSQSFLDNFYSRFGSDSLHFISILKDFKFE